MRICIFSDNIPPEFNSFDKSEPYIPPDPLEELHAKLGTSFHDAIKLGFLIYIFISIL